MSPNLESTATLLAKVRNGDGHARERLCTIYLPILTKWARGRLPIYARNVSETDDMVQTSLINALNNLGKFVQMHEGAFLAYLRKILLNCIRLEIRKSSNKSNETLTDNEIKDPQASQLEMAIGNEVIEKYEKALTRMDPRSREAVILRIEFGYTFAETAAAMNFSSANAARMKISRALLKLADKML
ncbi:MAG: sigma-70 family RNA polymerase sigma factor [Proteobacteria bacterium]|nr:sigma-70 family RNA polymerase sigma factor [Pseudomonadota bacterium]